MKIKVICIGKTGKKFLVEGESEYLKRLTRYIAFEKIEIPDIKNAKSLTHDQVKVAEGKEILSKIDSGDFLILLDENGKEFTSEKFADYLQNRFNLGGKSIVFVIGGAFGFSDELYQRANDKIALSKMTFSHQMIRMLFFEQVYRAMTILKGEPYHHS
ncbi:MAG: 23S rRNA (pseudouridine(1915)-N(3))-methyltransferase RlmH [Crocinitomicaceae bacterium]